MEKKNIIDWARVSNFNPQIAIDNPVSSKAKEKAKVTDEWFEIPYKLGVF
ncbi:hypothetical protein V6Z11_A10G183900 [Gossypium hirsutum]